MKRPTSPSILVQVAALAALAVVASQAVAFALVLTAPPPRPAGFSVAAAADALMGKPAETSDGRVLKRRLSDRPTVADQAHDPVGVALTTALAQRLKVPATSVRLRMQGPPERLRRSRSEEESGPHRFIIRRERSATARSDTPPSVVPPPPPPVVIPGEAPGLTLERQEFRVETADGPGPDPDKPLDWTPLGDKAEDVQVIVSPPGRTQQFTIRADRLTFAPFSASVRLADGRWATVQPPHGFLAPWQRRLLISLAISMLLLAPLVWIMARRLTQPIRVFARAAERLGADPEAEALEPSGPPEVRTAITAFNDMQASLRDHMRNRTQTIAAIAHDLRTPMTRLRFRAEQAPDALRDRMAADIEEMDALIGQAMAFVRGEATAERREPLDLTALAADVAAGFAETGASVTFDAQTPLTVLGDAGALRRALANLIGNAVKYAGSARVRAFAENGQAVIEVADDGPGLPPQELEAVFAPFHRGERSRNRETGGAGLGLTVARQAARAHGGDVSLANRDGGGLAARLTAPLAP